MIISRSFDCVEIQDGPSAFTRAWCVARAAGARVAEAVAAWRERRAIPRLTPFAPDSRTLRDIGLTPMGISEEALAALNEARYRAGGRA